LLYPELQVLQVEVLAQTSQLAVQAEQVLVKGILENAYFDRPHYYLDIVLRNNRTH
jgi:hypothetical protein